MVDITKCPGIDCKVKKQCYRYEAITGKWQSWYVKQPGNDKNCSEFLPIKKNTRKNRII